MKALSASRCGLARDGVCTLVRSASVSTLHAGQQPLLSSSRRCEWTTKVCQRRRRTRRMLVASSASIWCAAAARLPVLACGAAAQCAVCSRCSSHAWRSVQQLHDRRSVRFGRVALCMARFASRKFRDRRGCGQGGVFTRAKQVAPQRVTRACRAVVAPP